MKKAFPLLCAALLLVCVCAGCGDNTAAELPVGKYAYGKSTEVLKPFIDLQEKQRFYFMFSALSSYYYDGDYSLADDTLTLNPDGGGHTYTFQVQDGTLVFDAAESDPLPDYAKVPDGAVFVWMEEQDAT